MCMYIFVEIDTIKDESHPRGGYRGVSERTKIVFGFFYFWQLYYGRIHFDNTMNVHPGATKLRKNCA